jgi:hypothetical protein
MVFLALLVEDPDYPGQAPHIAGEKAQEEVIRGKE